MENKKNYSSKKKTDISEEFIHFIFEQKLFYKDKLFTSEGDKIEVISTGFKNQNAGPDFFNAKVKINDTLWAGNIEIHKQSSDWNKHGHNTDKAYNNVILHVVINNDKEVYNTEGKAIKTTELKFNAQYLNNYIKLFNSKHWIACEETITNIDNFKLNHWLNNLLVNRLESKSENIKEHLIQNKNNWEETFYQILARNFGFNINALPFELLAKSLPLTILGKHKNSLTQIQAILFGQAGFFEDNFPDDEYFNTLKKEYLFLKHKFKLKPIAKHLWKFMRLRPPNFPTIRIAQFAKLIHQSTSLFSKVISTNNTDEIKSLLSVEISGYWNTHYTFGKQSVKRNKSLGSTALNTIIINTIVPILFLYGKEKDNEKIKDKALSILENLEAEKNYIITKWNELQIKAPNAWYSQALIHLKKEYCDKNKCLKCQIGNINIRQNY